MRILLLISSLLYELLHLKQNVTHPILAFKTKYYQSNLMVREKKESRLSFRITPEKSDKIDEMIIKHNFIKDRSNFGTQSIDKFIQLTELKSEILSSIKSTLHALSKKVSGDNLPEVQKMLDIID